MRFPAKLKAVNIYDSNDAGSILVYSPSLRLGDRVAVVEAPQHALRLFLVGRKLGIEVWAIASLGKSKINRTAQSLGRQVVKWADEREENCFVLDFDLASEDTVAEVIKTWWPSR